MKRHRFLPWLLIFGIAAVGLALNWPLAPPATTANTRRRPDFRVPGGRRQAVITWRATTAAERQGATASIVAQLKAFKRNDFKHAISYQSSTLRRRFSSANSFRQMMQGYPQFMRYKSVRFGKSRASRRGRLVQIEVDLTGMDNVRAKALYLMVLENKIYRVGGVDGGRPLPVKTPIPTTSA